QLPADDTFSAVPLDRLPGGMRAYLHLPSVTVGEDEVVRYWLVIKGDGGGYNASFEGTRCSAQEYKVYAYGFPGRQEPVMPADDPGWRSTDAPGYRQELTADVLCTGPNPNTARQIDSVLRHGPRQGHAFDGFFRF
ncbi:MAG: CNP1-like family protein, partial [Gammaproteobacteria bacterium]